MELHEAIFKTQESMTDTWVKAQEFYGDHLGDDGLLLPEAEELYGRWLQRVEEYSQQLERLDGALKLYKGLGVYNTPAEV